MSLFLRWNDALAAHFFAPEKAGQPVWLDVSDELIEEIGQTLGAGGVPEFVATMKSGPPWPTPAGLCQRARKTCEGWRDRHVDYPPYIGYLALFVLAAGLEGAFAAHAYYPRLRTLLGEPPTTGALPSFDHMYELWDDLERWSVRDRNGELGILQARIAGGMFHIGLPLGQSVLAAEDRKALPVIFARAHLDPSSPPPDAELLRALRTQGTGLLRPRTARLVQGTGDRDALDALIDLVAEELEEWNGEVAVPDRGTGDGGARREVHAGFRLCMRIDRVSGRARATLRCTLNRRDIPEGGLRFSLPLTEDVECREEIPGWSTPLEASASGKPLDAARLDWLTGLSAAESRLGWTFRLPARSVRVLVSGDVVGLPGLIEVYQAPGSQPFYVLFHERESSRIEQWSRDCCEGFEVLAIDEGLPGGWKISSCPRVVKEDHDVARRYPMLARKQRISLRLHGGIRSGAGAEFFSFARPRILVEGGSSDFLVRCNGQELQVGPDGFSFELPRDLPLETRILIEVLSSSDAVLKRLSLYLRGEFAWNRSEPEELFDMWGQAEPEAGVAPRVSGASLMGVRETPSFKRPVLLTPGLAAHLERRVYFIGRVPGEIAVWPAEPLPDSWEPVWAVPMVRRGSALFCGSGLEESSPLPDGGLDRKRVEEWREVLWHRRKRIAPPRERRLIDLWRSYSESAHA